MTKTITAALFAAAFALPASYALAQPQHQSGHAPNEHATMPTMPTTDQDAHGDTVSDAAHTAKTDDADVGKTVSEVANDKNKGERVAKGHTKTHHAKTHHAKH